MARSRRGRPKKSQLTIKSKETNFTLGVVAIIIGGLFILSLFIDAPGFSIFKQYLGFSAIIAAVFFINWGTRFFGTEHTINSGSNLIAQFLLIFAVAGLIHTTVEARQALELATNGEYGGLLGYYLSDYLINIFSKGGAFFIFLVLTITLLVVSFRLPLDRVPPIFQGIVSFFKRIFGWFVVLYNKVSRLIKSASSKSKLDEVEPEERTFDEVSGKKMVSDLRGNEMNSKKTEPEKPQQEEQPTIEPAIKYVGSGNNPKIVELETEGVVANEEPQFPNWKLPPIDLLDKYTVSVPSDEDIKKNADIIEETLDSFGIQARVVDVAQGPTVTQYALNIALGTKVSKISNLKTDLALALAAPSGAIRIEAPIPGTSYIGVEIPNSKREIVQVREVMEVLVKEASQHKLGVVVGKNIDGKKVISDLQKMPHLLIAGATGSGKSVVMNGFITSLLMTKTPDEVRFIMVDPKQVELSFYNGIPHLLTPVIIEMDKVINALNWAIAEMEKRYTLFRQAKVKNIQGYNSMMGFPAIPYIVIVIDEMADMMLGKGVDVETSIVRLAQKARATGIHLLLATQRPSVDVLTGLIKANIPGRLGMSVATQIDSRVIIDQNGAETLLGKGDMLFKEPDKSKPFRIQGVWLSEQEIERVVEHIKEQIPEVHYTKEITESEESKKEAEMGEFKNFSEDDLFKDALQVVLNSRKASASMLQRKLKIGYNRAARLIDEMYDAGVVGPADGSKPRDVLISDMSQIIPPASAADDDFNDEDGFEEEFEEE
ncbi:DNA translocase FtsK 4TM domain-containing protein [Candidatus Dojkabacteria bacterium]|uniref:DNA translocase FtsK 4TM domain-containing protein n=1 Tax=Candidatus Dojkabacteria bacterium TaxID=2099670 RepID=A0A955L2Q9_9BACT|nr:DNA translocase FtsK 4TM domain-containing protein [Candidatus Dojkabacteria bacterium]